VIQAVSVLCPTEERKVKKMKYFMNSKFRLLLLGFVIGLIIGSARAKADYVIGEPINLGTTINSSAKDFNLNISADGLTLFFTSTHPGGYGGRDQARLLSVDRSGWSGLWPQTSTPDGKVLFALATAEKPGTGVDIVAIHLQSNGRIEPLLTSEYNELHAALSPDGKWLAYVSDEQGRNEVFVRSFPDLEGPWQISTEGGQGPVWAPDGAAIYYRDGASLVKVPVKTEGGFIPERAEPLFEDVYVSESHRNYDIHPDGKRFLMIKRSQEDAPKTELIVVENWSEELKRRVPTGKD
jgi:hypothetical protein